METGLGICRFDDFLYTPEMFDMLEVKKMHLSSLTPDQRYPPSSGSSSNSLEMESQVNLGRMYSSAGQPDTTSPKEDNEEQEQHVPIDSKLPKQALQPIARALIYSLKERLNERLIDAA